MARRREIDEADGERLIREAEGTGQPIDAVAFPLMDYRGSRLREVTFRDCDVGRLSFSGPLLRRIELVNCAFIDCSGTHHVNYRRVAFTGCRWTGGRVTGVISSSILHRCQFASIAIDELSMRKCRIDGITVSQLTGQGLTIQDCTVRSGVMDGRVERVNFTDLEVTDLDISALQVVDGGLLGIEGDMRLPDFHDSFVVRSEAVAELLPALRAVVRPVAHDTLEHLVSDGFELEWFDPRRLDAAPLDGAPRLLPDEQERVLRLLWEHRALRLPD